MVVRGFGNDEKSLQLWLARNDCRESTQRGNNFDFNGKNYLELSFPAKKLLSQQFME